MKSVKEKRKYVMDYMIDFYDTLDPSGLNSRLFREKYEKMSDNEFAKEFEKFLRDDSKKGFYLEDRKSVV